LKLKPPKAAKERDRFTGRLGIRTEELYKTQARRLGFPVNYADEAAHEKRTKYRQTFFVT
jgi:hypothetical protein